MKARQYMEQGIRIQERIDALTKHRDRVLSTTAKINGYSSSGGGNARKTESAVQLDEEIERQIKRLEEIKIDILRTIEKVQDNTYATILIEHYMNDVSLWDISYKTGFDYRTITRLHGVALEIVQRIIDGK